VKPCSAPTARQYDSAMGEKPWTPVGGAEEAAGKAQAEFDRDPNDANARALSRAQDLVREARQMAAKHPEFNRPSPQR
jgi:hypothetical protein